MSSKKQDICLSFPPDLLNHFYCSCPDLGIIFNLSFNYSIIQLSKQHDFLSSPHFPCLSLPILFVVVILIKSVLNATEQEREVQHLFYSQRLQVLKLRHKIIVYNMKCEPCNKRTACIVMGVLNKAFYWPSTNLKCLCFIQESLQNSSSVLSLKYFPEQNY